MRIRLIRITMYLPWEKGGISDRTNKQRETHPLVLE